MNFINRDLQDARTSAKGIRRHTSGGVRWQGDQSQRAMARLAVRLAVRLLALAALPAAGLTAANVHAEELSGPAAVVTAGVLRIGNQEIRLMGIDAPDMDQTCWDAKGEPWQCGEQAAMALKAKLQDAPLKCRGARRGQDGRLLTVCESGPDNINAWLVAEGWALAYRSQSLAFVGAEDAAREAAKGLWAGAFEPPSVWRKKHPAKSVL